MPSKRGEELEAQDPYGDLIPYADPSWYHSVSLQHAQTDSICLQFIQYHTPYFNLTHAALRKEVRQWVEDEIEPNVTEWDEAKVVPAKIYKQMGERGYLAGLMGLDKYPTHLTDNRVRSVGPEQWDLFHELTVTDEISRAGSGGLVWNLVGGFGIGCPPVVKFGKKPLVDRVLPGILNGDKRICLAITEPDAGSDVANLTCEAKLTEDGKHYIVNGEKKWITNGIWCDYFTTAVRTGGPGMNGVSVLLIEREHGGVSTRRMDCQGVWASGTTYITFEDVKVPVENLIGKENQGFKGNKALQPLLIHVMLILPRSHHDELQPRTNRYNHPVYPLLARLLRRIRQIRSQAQDLRQKAHRPPCHSTEARPHGSPNRGFAQLAGERHLPVPVHERDGSHAEAWWCDCGSKSPGDNHI